MSHIYNTLSCVLCTTSVTSVTSVGIKERFALFIGLTRWSLFRTLAPPTQVIPDLADAEILRLVHGDAGVLKGVLELVASLVSPVHQLEGAAVGG